MLLHVLFKKRYRTIHNLIFGLLEDFSSMLLLICIVNNNIDFILKVALVSISFILHSISWDNAIYPMMCDEFNLEDKR